MIKFKRSAFKNILAVINYNRYRPAYLNKQIIVLLLINKLKNEKDLFQMQDETLKEITKNTPKTLLSYIMDTPQAPVKVLLKACAEKNIDYGYGAFFVWNSDLD